MALAADGRAEADWRQTQQHPHYHLIAITHLIGDAITHGLVVAAIINCLAATPPSYVRRSGPCPQGHSPHAAHCDLPSSVTDLVSGCLSDDFAGYLHHAWVAYARACMDSLCRGSTRVKLSRDPWWGGQRCRTQTSSLAMQGVVLPVKRHACGCPLQHMLL